jgi:hypothetical protein
MDNFYISILLIALCIAISPAASRYTMEITAVSYANPSDEDSDGIACDIFSGSCDVYFKFCVRDIHTSPTNDICWPSHLIQSSHYIETQNYYFPTIGLLYPEAGVSNPITFTSSSAWPVSCSVFIVGIGTPIYMFVFQHSPNFASSYSIHSQHNIFSSL